VFPTTGEQGEALVSRFRVLLGEDPSDFGYVGAVKREPTAKRVTASSSGKRGRPAKLKPKRRKSKYAAPDSEDSDDNDAASDSEDYEG
jgi:hypothetical protein